MNNEADIWTQYAMENFAVAELCLQAGHLNACLQNAQQTVEKSLKAIRYRHGLPQKKTHSIMALCLEISGLGINVGLSREDCELLDAIYLDSKYPTVSVVPHSPPDQAICRKCVQIARDILEKAVAIVGTK